MNIFEFKSNILLGIIWPQKGGTQKDEGNNNCFVLVKNYWSM